MRACQSSLTKLVPVLIASSKDAAQYASNLGFDCHAGHGSNYNNVLNIAALKEIKELNIGHFIIGEAVFSCLKDSVLRMKEIIQAARQ